ncbi:protein transporter, partial [Conidiobolus coronatus NRRL 28638]
KAIAQVIIGGATILGKAFVEAYRVAAASAATQGASAASKTASDPISRQTGITLQEAYQILNAEKDSKIEDVKKKYEHLFNINDPAKGGSFYLQSKIFRAKERIDLEKGPAKEEAPK